MAHGSMLPRSSAARRGADTVRVGLPTQGAPRCMAPPHAPPARRRVLCCAVVNQSAPAGNTRRPRRPTRTARGPSLGAPAAARPCAPVPRRAGRSQRPRRRRSWGSAGQRRRGPCGAPPCWRSPPRAPAGVPAAGGEGGELGQGNGRGRRLGVCVWGGGLALRAGVGRRGRSRGRLQQLTWLRRRARGWVDDTPGRSWQQQAAHLPLVSLGAHAAPRTR